MGHHSFFRTCWALCILAVFWLPWGLTPPATARAQSLSFPAQINNSFSPIAIAAGGVSQLTIKIYNPNSFKLTLSGIPAALTDDIAPAGLSFASPPNAGTTCQGSVVSATGTSLSLIGGTVPEQVGTTPGSCTVTVNVTSTIPGNHVNTIGSDLLKATDPTGSIQITNTTPASATLQVNSVQVPSLTKSFAANTIWVGQTSTLTIRITNNDPTYALSAVSITDNLPANITVAAPPAITQCGGGTVTYTTSSVTLTGGSIAAANSCTVIATVTSTTPGVYINTIPAGAIHTQQAVTNAGPATAPLNVQNIGMIKSFSPTAFQVGGQSILTITLQNPSGSDYDGAGFVDNLPAGVTVVSGSATQCGGAVSYTSGSITLTGGTIPHSNTPPSPPGTCTITATVTSSIAASYTNSIPVGALTTNTAGVSNVLPANAPLTVYRTGEGITGSKSFSPNVIAVGAVSTLTISLRAPPDVVGGLTNLSLTDALPAGVSVANPPNATRTNCGPGVFAPAAGATLLSLSGASVPADQQCVLTVRVTSSTPGTVTNTISPANISSDQNRNVSGNFSATLSVSGLSVSKVFTPNTVSPNGVSTLTITLTNNNTSQLDNASLTGIPSTVAGDHLPGTLTNGVVIAPTPNARTTCGAGLVTAAANTQDIWLTGATIPAQVGTVPGICTISVDVVGKGASATHTNAIEAGYARGTIHGTTTEVANPARVTNTLRILPLTIIVNKDFTPRDVIGGSVSSLSVILTNPNTVPLSGIGFTDNLPQSALTPGKGMRVATPANPNVGACGGSISIAADRKSFTFSGGGLNSSGVCTLTLNVMMDVEANLTNTVGVGAVTSTNGASNPQAAFGSLTNLIGASLSKYFAPNMIQASAGSTTLGLTIQNIGNVDLTGMGYADTLPAGMAVTTPFNASQCGGTVAWNAGTRTLTLAGGTLVGFGNCTVEVPVTVSGAGVYSNCVPAGGLINDQHATNQTAACDTLTALLPPTITKAFSPNPIAAGTLSTLTFTLTNPAANTVPLTGVGFTDTFPTGLTLASLPNAAQCSGTVTSTAGSVTLTGGTLGINPLRTCTVTVGVTAAGAGSYVNTSEPVTSTNGGTGSVASNTLNVIAPPVIAKQFSPAVMQAGETSTLTFQINNPNPTATLTGVGFTDALPLGMQVVGPPVTPPSGCNASSTPTFAPLAGDTSLTLSNASIAGGGTCTLSVDVTASGGAKLNTTGAVISTNGGAGNTASATLDVQGGGLALLKSTSSTSYQAEGDTVDYDYLLTNTGSITLYAPFVVTDDHVASIDCGSASTLAPLGTLNCTGSYAVQAADITSGSVTNIATATAQDADSGGNTVTSNESRVTVRLAALALTKITTTGSYRVAGNTINYTYTLTNTGGVTLYAPFQVSDDHFGSPLGTAFTCGSAVSLPPGGNVTCARTYTLTQADIDNLSSITNVATASARDALGGDPVNSTDESVTVYELVNPTFSKAFSASPVAIGGSSILTFTLTNPASNAIPITGVGFTDTFPSGVIVANAPNSNQCGGTVTSTAGSVTLAGATLIPGSSCAVTVTVTGTTAGTKNNTTAHLFMFSTVDTLLTANAQLQVVAPPTISKSFSPNAITVGGASHLTFTLSAPAANPVALAGISFGDTLPDGVSVAGTPNPMTTCTGVGVNANPGEQSITVTVASLAAGTSCTVTLDVTASASGIYYNTTGPITSTNGGSGTTSNTAVLTATDSADLSITKTDGRLAVDRTEAVSYTIVAHNAGPSDVTGALVSDTFPSTLMSVTWTCSPDAGATCTGSGAGNIHDSVSLPANTNVTYTVSALVTGTAATDIINSASVISLGMTEPDISNNIATDSDALNRLTVAKGVTPSTYSAVGESVSYSYTITNAGTSSLSAPFDVPDDKVTPLCTAPDVLAPSESFTCTATYAIAQADLDAGSITNTVYATARDADGDTVTSNTDTETIDAIQSTVLALDKTLESGSPYESLGDSLSYGYLLTNNGNVTLRGAGTGGIFTVTDDRATVTCPPAPTGLAPGASVTCTSAYSITQDDLDAGTVLNSATGRALFGASAVESNEDTQTASGIQTPALRLAKTLVSGNPYESAGDVLNYSYLLTNEGNVTLTGTGAGGIFTITDDKAAVTCPPAPTSLAPSASVTCTAAYTVVAGDLGNSVTNHATGHAAIGSTPVDSNQDSARAVGAPVLAITKDDHREIVSPGSSTEYTLRVTNSSLQAASGIDLVDNIPDGTIFVSATGSGIYDDSTRRITWPPFGLQAGASIELQLRLTVASAEELASAEISMLTNTAHVQDDGTHSNGTVVQGDASDTDAIAVSAVKSLTGTEQAGSADLTALIGEVLDYSIRIDIPTGTIRDLKAVDILDHGLAFVGCDATTPISSGSLVLERNPCIDASALSVQAEPVTDIDPASVDAGRHITFDFGEVRNPGATQTLVVNYRVIVLDIADNVDGLSGLNNSLEWSWEGGTLSGAASGVDIIEPQLTIGKTVKPVTAELGSTVVFTIEVAHAASSTAPAYDVLVTDVLPETLGLDQSSITVTGSAGLPPATVTSSPTQFSVFWPSFPRGETATITFEATFIGPAAAENIASVEWSSIQIDPQPHLQPLSSYNLHSTERRYDPEDPALNDYLAQASATIHVPLNPRTGFAPNVITTLPSQPAARAYRDLGSLWVEIPRLGVQAKIVGVPLGPDGEWDLSWLGSQAGYLNGTAYPTHAGNSILTAHVYLPNGLPGPFVDLHSIRWGEQIIVHLGGQRYIYEVRADTVISPMDGSAFQHEEFPWLTLITCKDYDAATNTYRQRVVVRAVLVKIEAEQAPAAGPH